MSLQLSVYVGPYLVVPRHLDWSEWDGLLSDGRMEAGVGDDELTLIPAYGIPGIERQLTFEQNDESVVTKIDTHALMRENAEFCHMIEGMLGYCVTHNIEIVFGWGIVPCIS